MIECSCSADSAVTEEVSSAEDQELDWTAAAAEVADDGADQGLLLLLRTYTQSALVVGEGSWGRSSSPCKT